VARTAEANVFTETVTPLVRTARAGGATVDSLTKAFLAAIEKTYGVAEARQASAAVGFIQLLAAEGGSVGAEEAAKLYGGPTKVHAEAVRKAAREGNLIVVKDGLGSIYFPVWQFGVRGGTVAGLREVLEVLRQHPHYDDLLPLTFFLNPAARLGGRSPLAALRSGKAEEIAAVRVLAATAVE